MKIISNKRYDEFVFAEHEYKGLQEYVEILIKSNKELIKRINDVISYINIQCGENCYEYLAYMHNNLKKELLKILEGDK